MEKAISILISIPKGDTILLWLYRKAQFLGIKGNALNHLESAIVAVNLMHAYSSVKSSTILSATNTIGISKYTDISLAIKKVEKNLEQLNLNGLAKDLGITKEVATRLIWSFADVQNTKSGLEIYSSEIISLVKNAVLREHILKQTTSQLDFQLLWTKNESLLMSKQWDARDYGIKKMVVPYVASVIAI